MALYKNNFKIDGNNEMDCKIKILGVSGSKENLCLEVAFYYKDSEFIVNKDFYLFTPDISNNSRNFIKQGYEYLKTLKEFDNAIDILEDGQLL